VDHLRHTRRLEERLAHPSDTVRVRRRIREQLMRDALSEQVCELVVLCAEEACTNALRHSGSREPIELSVESSSDSVVVVVSDHGRGFDLDRFDPEATPDPWNPGGRGLWLIARLMDGVELVSDDGLTVKMTKLR
jgi:anti-sigma regulatory factor (Ser/Thr protein kinase)